MRKNQEKNLKTENDIFDSLRYGEDGKFINENTEIIRDEKNDIVTLINKYPDGHIDKVILKLREKQNK